jgi:mRNA interferase RelE/StbE
VAEEVPAQFDVVLTASALRSLESIPPRIVEPLVSFIFGGLAEFPRKRGNPLQRELEGKWAARRGDYRILYELDETAFRMTVLKIAHRANAYR